MMNTKIISEVTARPGNTLTKLSIAVLLFSSACSSTYQTRTYNEDDVYYSAKDAPSDNEANYETPANPDNYTPAYDNSVNDGSKSNTQSPSSTSEEYYDEKGNTYVTNNYYSDDYYDYAYASRVRRFYRPVYAYSYYDSYYTNSYWYDYNPLSWGVSIYLGYNWWPFSYYSVWNYPGYLGWYSYGYPYYHHHHHHHWFPSYMYGYYGYGYGDFYGYGYGGCGGYGSYGYGGYDGYYYGGYNNPYYYNSYDATSHYYGPRTSTSSNGKTANQSLAQLYEKESKNSGMNALQGDKAKLSQPLSEKTPSKSITSFGSSIPVKTEKGVQIEDDKNAVKGQHGLSPVNNAVSKDKAIVFTGKPVDKFTPDKTVINKPPDKSSVGKPNYSQPKGEVKSGSYYSKDYYKGEMKSNTDTKTKSMPANTYSKPKSNQSLEGPKSYGRSPDIDNRSTPRSNSYSNYSKPGSPSNSRSNYIERGNSNPAPSHNYSSPKSSGQSGTSVGRTQSPSNSQPRTSSPSRSSKPR